MLRFHTLVGQLLFLALVLLAPAALHAGGQATVTRNSISTAGTTSSSYINPTLQSWQNTDSINVTIKFSDGNNLTISPGEIKERAFTSTTTYYVEGYPSAAGTIVLTDPLHATNIGTNNVALAWGPYQYYDGSPTIGYQIQRATGSTTAASVYWTNLSSSTTTTTFNDTTAAPNTTYTYRVSPCLSWSFCFFYSNEIVVTTSASTATTSGSSNATTTSTTGNTSTTTTVSNTSNKTTASSLPTVAQFADQNYTPGNVPVHNNKELTLTGSAKANSTLLITIHSDPISQQVNTDNQGIWKATFDLSSVGSGEHIIVAQYYENGTLGAETGVVRFIYEQPEVVQTNTEEAAAPVSINTPPIPKQTSATVWIWWTAGIVIAIVPLVTWLVLWRRRKKLLVSSS